MQEIIYIFEYAYGFQKISMEILFNIHSGTRLGGVFTLLKGLGVSCLRSEVLVDFFYIECFTAHVQ